MRSTVVLLLVTVALVGATGAVAAADGQSAGVVEVTERPDGQTESPPWPGDETTTGNNSDGDDAVEDDSSESNSASSDSSSSNSASSDSSGSNSASSDSSGVITPGEDTSGESTSEEDESTSEEDESASEEGESTPEEDESAPEENTPEENTPERETTSVSPGQHLAGAVGAQGASVQGELWNRTLSERLSAANTPDERAEVVTDETETIETYVDALEAVRANVTGAWESGEMSEGEYRAALSEFVVRAHSVERRANQTVRAAERLPEGVRERNDVNVTHVRNLAEQAHDLYQFEDPIAQQVANETLANQSALAGVLPEGERTNQSRTQTGQ